jgi:hypothetical protein
VNRKAFIAILVLLAIVFSSTAALAMEKSISIGAPQDVLKAAEEGLAQYKSAVKSDFLKWGLSSIKEADNVTLGDGYEVRYLGENILLSSSAADILSLEDKDIFSTWIFILELRGEAKTFMIICKEGDASYTFSGFGGNPTYFTNAINSVHEFAGIDAKPLLLKYGQQDFLLVTKNEVEYVIPVPYDDISNERVISGEGAVKSSQLIIAIQRAHQEYIEKYSNSVNLPVGSFYIDVWAMESYRSISIIVVITSISSLILIALIVAFILARRDKFKNGRKCA